MSYLPETFSSADKNAWLAQVKKDLKEKDFNETLVTENEDIKIQPLYTKDDLPEIIKDEDAEFGEDIEDEISDPFESRGETLLTWSICEEMDISEAENLNETVLASVGRGANCIRISSTTDHAWDKFFDAIFTIEYPSPFILHTVSDLTEENIVNIWRERIGYMGSRDTLISAIEFDPVSYWIANGKIENEGKTINNLSEIYFRLTAHMQDCRLIKIDTSSFGFNDKSCAEQLAYAAGIASYYFDKLTQKNIPAEELMHLVSFRFFVGSNYFMEIAKLRAFKIVWSNLLKAFMPELDYIPNPYIHAVINEKQNDITSYDNLYRLTTEAMSAILGECDTLSIYSDIIKDRNGKRLTTNIQNILRFETHMDAYREAANGSFYLEALTVQLAENAWQIFRQMESEGGFIECWKNGKIK